MFKIRTSYKTKTRHRRGVAAIEFALFLPVMVVVCFGSIQLCSSIFLRHQALAVLEAGSLDYMLGNVLESKLPAHIETLAEEFGLVGVTAGVTPVDTNFLKVELTLPVQENLALPAIIGNLDSVESEFLLYRPPSAAPVASP